MSKLQNSTEASRAQQTNACKAQQAKRRQCCVSNIRNVKNVQTEPRPHPAKKYRYCHIPRAAPTPETCQQRHFLSHLKLRQEQGKQPRTRRAMGTCAKWLKI